MTDCFCYGYTNDEHRTIKELKVQQASSNVNAQLLRNPGGGFIIDIWWWIINPGGGGGENSQLTFEGVYELWILGEIVNLWGGGRIHSWHLRVHVHPDRGFTIVNWGGGVHNLGYVYEEVCAAPTITLPKSLCPNGHKLRLKCKFDKFFLCVQMGTYLIFFAITSLLSRNFTWKVSSMAIDYTV